MKTKIYTMKETWTCFIYGCSHETSLSVTLGRPVFTPCTDLQLVFHLFFKAEILGALLLLGGWVSKNAAGKPLWTLPLQSLPVRPGLSGVTGVAVSWLSSSVLQHSPHSPSSFVKEIWFFEPTCFWIYFSLLVRKEKHGDLRNLFLNFPLLPL